MYIFSQFHKNNKQIGITNMFNNKKSLTHRFIENYKKLETQYEGKVNQEQLYQETMELLKRGRERNEDLVETETLSNIFKEAQSNQKSEIPKINISNIFKD